MKNILLTGGLGYIGSHVAVELSAMGFNVIIVDDLSNSELFVLDRIKELTNKDIIFIQGDIRDENLLDSIFKRNNVDGIIHFAAKKAVGESVDKPLLYYDINVSGLINLLKVVKRYTIEKFIFSSSCTVYGNPDQLPVTEITTFGETPSPYGKTKQMCERILQDFSKDADFSIVSLRYFNPVGAHDSALIGELPKGVPNNLVPFITQTAAGFRESISIFGGDYNTADGTAIRDYIHVVDLAKAHVYSLKSNLEKYIALNIGTGRGYSVLEVVTAFEKVTGVKLPYSIVGRRSGDIPMIYGDTTLANEKLDWKAEQGLEEMLIDAWNWQQRISM